MTKTFLILALAAVTLGAAAAQAQTRSANRWPAGVEQRERAITRDLNNQQADQPGQYSMAPYHMAPHYSYAPAPQYSYAPPRPSYPQPYYAYPYDYPPQPWYSRYF